MKKTLLRLCCRKGLRTRFKGLMFGITLLSLSITANAQLRAFYPIEKFTVSAGSNRKVDYKIKVKVPADQTKFKNCVITMSLIKDDFSVPDSSILLSQDNTVKYTGKEVVKDFIVNFTRDDNDDRRLVFQLSAKDSTGKDIKLIDSATKHKVLIKPFQTDTLSTTPGLELWFFTGTNLDLLDGLKPEELYLKGSFLYNFKNSTNKPSKHWAYFRVGKNRYFSDKDSISRQGFSDIDLIGSTKDSVSVITGNFNTLRQSSIDNTFISLDYLYNFSDPAATESKLLFSAGLNFSLQDVRTKFTNTIIRSDTARIFRMPDSVYRFRPVPTVNKQKQYNYNINVGFMHIFQNKNFDIKNHLVVGLNSYNFALSTQTSLITTSFNMASDAGLYAQLTGDWTFLGLGLSFGYDLLLRRKQYPLVNFSLTKTLDYKQLKSLFSGFNK